MSRPDALDPAAASLAAWLASQRIGGLSPGDVRVQRREDSFDELSWFFEVVLPVPPDDGAWDVPSINRVKHEFRDRALAAGLEWPWYIVLAPDHDERRDDEAAAA